MNAPPTNVHTPTSSPATRYAQIGFRFGSSKVIAPASWALTLRSPPAVRSATGWQSRRSCGLARAVGAGRRGHRQRLDAVDLRQIDEGETLIDGLRGTGGRHAQKKGR